MIYLGLIGYPLKHSISPAFQQAAFDHCGLAARYEAWETAPAEVPAAIARLRGEDYLGLNVTVPHKQAVLPLLDEVDPLAQRIGAVNTIVKRGGRLIGHNTDADGFLRGLRVDGGFDPGGRRAVLLGAGGAARAVAFALLGAGASHLWLVNRNEERAAALAGDLGEARVSVAPLRASHLAPLLSQADLLVNCTTVGMAHAPGAGQSVLPAELLAPHLVVYDLVYTPEETPLLAAARRAGARAIGGLPMLVYQGAAAFTLWFARPAPVEVMFAAARQALARS